MSVLRRVVIVGGGFGGINVARGLKRVPVHVTVVDKSNHHVFQPLLYQVATAGLSPADISAPIRSILRKQSETEILMSEVQGVDKNSKEIILRDRRIPYDTLVIATGAWHSYFGHDEWAESAPGLKSLSDATKIREKILLAFEAAELSRDPVRMKMLLNFAIVGGGPTGVELAGAIAELARKALASDFRHIHPEAAQVVLIEAGPRILAAFPEDLSEKAMRGLQRLGVEVRVNSRVEKVDEQGVVISGQRLASKTVIWAAGVVASPAGKWLGAETDRAGRVKVLPDLTIPGHPEIFVIGDVAAVMQDGQLLPGVAPVAIQEGRYVASVIRARVRGKEARPVFRYFDKGNLATVGRSFAVGVIGRLHLSGFVAWVTWLAIHIYYLIGFRNRFLVLFQWAWAYLTFQRGARLIYGQNDESCEKL